jgi:uncharacterized protein (TIGR02147 family)
MIQAAPNLYGYLDYRSYLRDWFAARKVANPRFSHRVFARLAGQRSPSLLKHVMDGQRNLTSATTEAFIRALKLTVEEAEFFTWLVRLDQAESTADRNRAWERISATRHFRDARKIEGEGFRYLSHWYIPAVRELATIPGFRADPAWVARILRPRITEAQGRQALSTLQELGMLVPGPNGEGLVAAEAVVVTPHEVARLAVENYHQGMLSRASESIGAFDPEERHLGAVTLALPESLVPKLKQELAAFQERLCSLIEGVEDPVERVYQVNLQLFPLSATVPAPHDGDT